MIAKVFVTAALVGLTLVFGFLFNSACNYYTPQQTVLANDPGADEFTGSEMKVEKAVESATLIVIGRIIDVGIPEADAPGEIYYNNAKIEVTRTLKGDHYESLMLDYKVRVGGTITPERLLVRGTEYLFLLKKNNKMNAIKILPSDAKNLAAIQNKIDLK